MFSQNKFPCCKEIFKLILVSLEIFSDKYVNMGTSQVMLVVKNLPASARDREEGLVPGSLDTLEEGTATHSSILTWRIPWTEEPGGLQSIG